ncbi:hypothetical protein [Burkholderia multivorans]|uniref:hypothetical protein n=1 Tax=Burkholderia multivorans TaxID=87883 RepID=UPI0019D0AE42|nr:hypothetical protein [Burkholderia multivorans]MBN6728538.1 hypothetical protein [Burkholderia multivorans]
MDPQKTTSAEQARMLMLRGAIAMMPQEQQDAIDGYAKTIRSMISADPLAALALGLVGSELAAGVEVKA